MDIDPALQESQSSPSYDGDADSPAAVEHVTSPLPSNNDGSVETKDLATPPYAIPLPPTHHSASPHLFLYQDSSSQATAQPLYDHIGLPYSGSLISNMVSPTDVKTPQRDGIVAKSSCTNPTEDSPNFAHSPLETVEELLEAGSGETLHEEHAQRPRGKVQRVFQACLHCKRRKSKCDGQRPSCSSCVKLNIPCEWASERRMRGPNKNKKSAGESRPRKSRVNFPPDVDEDQPPPSPQTEGFVGQPPHPILIGGNYPPLPPHYDLTALQQSLDHPYPQDAHLIDPAVYQAALHAQMLMNAHLSNSGHVGSISDAQPSFAPLGDGVNSAQEGSSMVRVVSVSDISMHSLHGIPSHLTSHPESLTPSLADVKAHLKSPVKAHLLPSPTVTPKPYILPEIVLQHPGDFHNRHQFQELVDGYLRSLNRKTSEKALLTQSTYDAVTAHLHDQDPPVTSVEAEPAVKTALFKFWARKSFALETLDGQEIVMHNRKPVAVREQLYDILITCHALAKHGGRDKTCGFINEHYSWVPKSFVDAFVRSCPGCPRKRRTGALNQQDPTNLTSADSDSFLAVTVNQPKDSKLPDGLTLTDWHMGMEPEGDNGVGGEKQEKSHMISSENTHSQQSSSVPSSPLGSISQSTATINNLERSVGSNLGTAKSVIRESAPVRTKRMQVKTAGQNRNTTTSTGDGSLDDNESMNPASTP